MVTQSGITIEVKDEQSEKADSPIEITPFPSVTEVKDEQPEKAPYKTFPPVIVTDFNDEGM